MYNCPNCQSPFEKGTSFCQSCGCNLMEEFLIEPICPVCKKEFPGGSKFCDVEGSKLTTKDKLVPKCIVCGKEYTEEVKFCPADGGSIIAEAYRQSASKAIQQKPSSDANIGGLRSDFQNISSTAVSQLNSKFVWFTWLYWGGILGLLIIIGIFPLIAAWILGLTIQYQAWSMIQSINPRTTPGKAIGFQFIPFFSLYWVFIAYRGLAIDMNKFTSINDIPAPKMNEDLGTAISILVLFGIIPYPATVIMVFIAFLIMNFIFIRDLKNVMIAILEDSASRS